MFHSLRVKSIEKSTKQSSVVELEVPTALQSDFSFKAGQYLTLRTWIQGEEVRRSYSLCSSPHEKEWKIGVKWVEGGKFSTYVQEVLKVGDSLEVMYPDGRFHIPLDRQRKRAYVAFAAGSGITPIISLIKSHLHSEPNSTFKLFYVNQRIASIMLKEELADLKNTNIDRLEIFHLLTQQDRNIPLFNGRIDKEKLDIIFKSICDIEFLDHFFVCGPEPMIHLINRFLEDNGVEKEQIHFELFGTNMGHSQAEKKKLAKDYGGRSCQITIVEGGKSLEFEMEQGSTNVLDAALGQAADLPFACKGGVCATCKARVESGEVKMLLTYGLEQEEIEEGYILSCQAIPTSNKLVVNFDT